MAAHRAGKPRPIRHHHAYLARSVACSRQARRLSRTRAPDSRWRPGRSKPVAAGCIRVRYPLVRSLLRSRQPAAGTAIRAREPTAAAGWT